MLVFALFLSQEAAEWMFTVAPVAVSLAHAGTSLLVRVDGVTITVNVQDQQMQHTIIYNNMEQLAK